MLTQESQASAPASTIPPGADQRVRISRVTPAGAATVVTAALGALGLVWLLYEQMLAFSGVLGFWLSWYAVFVLLYAWMAWQQWGRREATDKAAVVAVTTAGLLSCAAVLGLVLFVLAKGFSAVRHLSFFTQSMAFAGPLSPLAAGGVLHAIAGTLEQIALGTLFAVPLGLLAALFLAEVGGPDAQPIRVIVEAMTALPDVIAGLFIYALAILTLGLQKSGLAAALALAVTMMPIVARASELVLRLVPGTLQEGSYALGASHWRTITHVVLPTARSGLATAVVLAMARGIGETAPVLVVSGVTKEMNLSPLHGPQMSLPLFIWDYAHVEAVNQTVVTRAFGAGLTLVVVVVVLFAAARALGGNAPGELTRRQQRRLTRQAART
ncbi:MAG TPA: phosphate ABC transporter permease PstA [Streptosporangiaceae bacterium]